MEQKFFPCLIYIVTNIYISDCYMVLDLVESDMVCN